MAGYAIYLPSVRGANPEHLINAGLAGLLKDGASPEFADQLDHAPDGGRGMLATWRPLHCPEQSFNAADYDWTPAKADKARGLAEGRFWFGMLRGKRVEPRDLARREMQDGYFVTLADGNRWLIPSAINFPHKLGLTRDGDVIREVTDEFRGLYNSAEQHAGEFFRAFDQIELLKRSKPNIDPSALTVEFTLRDTFLFCADFLALNYRLCPEVVDHLGLLDDMTTRNVIKAAIDLPCIFEGVDKPAKLSVPVFSRKGA